MSKHQPAESFPVEHFIREELVALGWSEKDLAARLGLDVYDTRDLMEGKTTITQAISRALSRVFGTSADYWWTLYLRHKAFEEVTR